MEDSWFGKQHTTCLTGIASCNLPKKSIEESAIITPILHMKKTWVQWLAQGYVQVSESGTIHSWAEPRCVIPTLYRLHPHTTFSSIPFLPISPLCGPNCHPGPLPSTTPFSPLPLRHNQGGCPDIVPPGVPQRAIPGVRSVRLPQGCHLAITLYFYRWGNWSQERLPSFLKMLRLSVWEYGPWSQSAWISIPSASASSTSCNLGAVT